MGAGNSTRFPGWGVCEAGMNAKRVKKRKTGGRRDSAGKSTVDSVIRAVDAFRRGRAVLIRDKGARYLAYAAETIAQADLDRCLRGNRPTHLVLSHARARTLKIRLYTPEIVALALAPKTRVAMLHAIADPTDDLDFPMKGPFDAERRPLASAFPASVKLAKLSGLLPASVIRRAQSAARETASLSVSDIFAYDDEIVRTLKLVSRAQVPLEGAEQAELVSFRPSDGGPEHYAIVIGSPLTATPVLTRLHSECFTGDLLGSLKCDCGNQLRGAIEAISREGAGILLYLAQEGRGIGLINKLRAYRLQDQGFDTLAANERLGFEADERLYGIAARMLSLLGYRAVRLLTNNPDKVRALGAAGIEVTARVPHAFAGNVHNRKYLKTKAEKAGHVF
jgi:GTP cyclohydrolase II